MLSLTVTKIMAFPFIALVGNENIKRSRCSLGCSGMTNPLSKSVNYAHLTVISEMMISIYYLRILHSIWESFLLYVCRYMELQRESCQYGLCSLPICNPPQPQISHPTLLAVQGPWRASQALHTLSI